MLSLFDASTGAVVGSGVVVASFSVFLCVVGSLVFSSALLVGCSDGINPNVGGNPNGYGGNNIVATGAAACAVATAMAMLG